MPSPLYQWSGCLNIASIENEVLQLFSKFLLTLFWLCFQRVWTHMIDISCLAVDFLGPAKLEYFLFVAVKIWIWIQNLRSWSLNRITGLNCDMPKNLKLSMVGNLNSKSINMFDENCFTKLLKSNATRNFISNYIRQNIAVILIDFVIWSPNFDAQRYM